MEAFASIVLLVIAMFVYAGFPAVTEKLDEIIERLLPQRHPGHTAAATDHRAAAPGTAASPRHSLPRSSSRFIRRCRRWGGRSCWRVRSTVCWGHSGDQRGNENRDRFGNSGDKLGISVSLFGRPLTSIWHVPGGPSLYQTKACAKAHAGGRDPVSALPEAVASATRPPARPLPFREATALPSAVCSSVLRLAGRVYCGTHG